MKLKIKQGNLFDPQNRREGEIEDIYVKDGVVTAPFQHPDETILAKNLIVLPGAIDPDNRFCSFGLDFYAYKHGLPSARLTAVAFAQLGYTHLNESLMTPLTANSVQQILTSLPIVDTSAYLVLPVTYIDNLIREKKDISAEVGNLIINWMRKYRAVGLKIQQPFIHHTERQFMQWNLKAGRVLSFLSTIKLSGRIIIETDPMLLENDPSVLRHFHLARLALGIDGDSGYKKASALIESGVEFDIGMPVESLVHRMRMGLNYSRGISGTTELDLGFSDPVTYYFGSSMSPPNMALKILDDPSHRRNLAMTVDCISPEAPIHYPSIFRRLTDKKYNFSITDITRMTRTIPARQLGFKNKGHLGIGATGDIAIYDPDVFTEPGTRAWKCRYLIKSGKIVIDNYRITNTSSGCYEAPNVFTADEKQPLSMEDKVFAGAAGGF